MSAEGDVTREIGEGTLDSRARLGRQHSGEVGQLAHSINEMASRIEGQLRGQRELLASVSHEIRTTLSRLRVLTEILRDKGVDEKPLLDIEREIAEVDDLTGQLLASSRLEFDILDKRELCVTEVARTSLTRSSQDLDLLKVTGRLRPVLGDATLLARALVNLIENAHRHGAALVELAVHFDEEQLIFAAKDNGPGFLVEDLGRVFDPFFRAKNSGLSVYEDD